MARYPIVIVDYNPIWPVQFRELASCLEDGLRPLAKAIEHVGSTAVPGLVAKPILDIDVVIPSRDELGEAIRLLGQMGYHHEGDLGVIGREAFCRSGSDTPRDGSYRVWPNHHLYVCAEDCRELARHLAFRDYLRQSLAIASKYAELKKTLAEQFRNDRDAYSEGKTSFVEEVLRGIEAKLDNASGLGTSTGGSSIAAWGAIIQDQNRILLVKRDYGNRNWILPGGTVESGESPMDAARREVEEETGLVVAIGQLIGIYFNPERDLLHVVFRCDLEAGQLAPRPGEIEVCEYFEENNLPRPLSNFVYQCIQDALSGRHSAFFRVNPPVEMLK